MVTSRIIPHTNILHREWNTTCKRKASSAKRHRNMEVEEDRQSERERERGKRKKEKLIREWTTTNKKETWGKKSAHLIIHLLSGLCLNSSSNNIWLLNIVWLSLSLQTCVPIKLTMQFQFIGVVNVLEFMESELHERMWWNCR